MILRDCIGNSFKQHSLTGLRLRNDQSPLPLTNRSKEVHDPCGIISGRGKEVKLFVWEEWSKVIEGDPVANLIRLLCIDGINLKKGEIFLTFFGRTNRAMH